MQSWEPQPPSTPLKVKGCQLLLWVCSALAAEQGQGWWHGNDGTGVTKSLLGKGVILRGWGASVLCVKHPPAPAPPALAVPQFAGDDFCLEESKDWICLGFGQGTALGRGKGWKIGCFLLWRHSREQLQTWSCGGTGNMGSM